MEIIPHEGISITSILRGIIGLSTIILIAYLLSNNKKRIDWKTIIIGLSSQLVICLLYTSPSPRDRTRSRMPSSA